MKVESKEEELVFRIEEEEDLFRSSSFSYAGIIIFSLFVSFCQIVIGSSVSFRIE